MSNELHIIPTLILNDTLNGIPRFFIVLVNVVLRRPLMISLLKIFGLPFDVFFSPQLPHPCADFFPMSLEQCSFLLDLFLLVLPMCLFFILQIADPVEPLLLFIQNVRRPALEAFECSQNDVLLILQAVKEMLMSIVQV